MVSLLLGRRGGRAGASPQGAAARLNEGNLSKVNQKIHSLALMSIDSMLASAVGSCWQWTQEAVVVVETLVTSSGGS